MNPQILEDKERNINMEDLIDLNLVAILDNVRELGLNLLNKAKNSVIDNFCSIKWLYHEIEELKAKMGKMNKQMKSNNQGFLAN